MTLDRRFSGPSAAGSPPTPAQLGMSDGQSTYDVGGTLTGWLPPLLMQGRLSLTPGTYVTTADVVGATTLYYTPGSGTTASGQGLAVTLYDGTRWKRYQLAEVSLALTGLTLTNATNYDVFLYDSSGTLTLELLAWTSNTARVALALQDGVYVRGSNTAHRYVGTIRTTSTTTTEDSGLGQAVKTAPNRFVWNMYNRVRRPMRAWDNSANYTYSSNTIRQVNAQTWNQCNFVVGVNDQAIEAYAYHLSVSSVLATGMSTMIGLDSTSANSGLVQGHAAPSTAGSLGHGCKYMGYPGIGYHFLAWLEQSGTGGTTTWVLQSTAGAGTADRQSGLVVDWWG